MNKESLKLDYPFPMGDSQKTRYKRNGILFSQRTAKGYARVDSPFHLTAADFASLSFEDLHDLAPHFASTIYDSLVDEAQRIQLLRNQGTTVYKDGFPYPTSEKPYTWALHEKIPNEIEKQLERLKNIGVYDVKIGLEMEFSCLEDAISGFTHWHDVKDKIILDLSSRAKATESEDERKTIQERISQVKSFNAREVLMYDLIELDPRTKPVLESLFGQSRDGDGYYDAQGVLELKLKPVAPLRAIENRLTVLHALYNKVTEYGLELRSHPSFHVNISFWDDDGNLFDDSHPRFSTEAKALTEGITKVFYDNIFVLLEKYEMESDELMSFGLSTNRQTLLRYSSGRIEVRPSVHSKLQDPNIMISMLLAGALYGLSDQEKGEHILATEVISPVVHHTRNKFKIISHVLNNALIDKDGTIQVPDEYIEEHIDALEYELGLTKSPPSQSYVHALLKLFFRSDYLPFIKDFFNNLKAGKTNNGQLLIQFPTTSDGIYEFTIPAINMDKIPRELQVRLEEGEDIEGMRKEINKYLEWGDTMPKPARRCVIDVQGLAKSLTVTGTHSKFVVQGYDLNTLQGVSDVPDDWTPPAWARYQRMITSDCLRQGYTPEFLAELISLTQVAAQSEMPLTLIAVDQEQIRKELILKIQDRDWKIETIGKELRRHWQKHGMVEGSDFIRRAIKIEFKDRTNKDSFAQGLSGILDDFNEVFETQYWYKIDSLVYTGGTYDIHLQIEPNFLQALRAVV